MKRYVLLGLVLSIILTVVSCNMSIGFYKISPERVEKITVSAMHTEEIQLDAQETEKLIGLYNDSEYKGSSNGWGGTPNYQVDVTFKDGRVLHIYEHNGVDGDLEVQFFDANGYTRLGVFLGCYYGYYIDSQELVDYIAELITKAEAK